MVPFEVPFGVPFEVPSEVPFEVPFDAAAGAGVGGVLVELAAATHRTFAAVGVDEPAADAGAVVDVAAVEDVDVAVAPGHAAVAASAAAARWP